MFGQYHGSIYAVAGLTLIMLLVVLPYPANGYPGVRINIPESLTWYPIAAFGDNRPENTAVTELPSTYYQLVNEVRTARPFALLGTGDHVGAGRLNQIITFLSSLTDVENVFVIEGNHDIGPAHSYWVKEVAPEMYFWDGIPGWRVVLFSTEIPRTEYRMLQSFLDTALNTSRHVVLVFHRPAYPDIGYNIDPGMRSILMSEIRKYGNVELALQGHWHGFAEELVNETLFIITGGAGAPLYQSGEKNHYLYIVLEPEGAYEVIPVALGPGSGEITVKQLDDEVIVTNTKISINDSPVKIPVRVKLPVDSVDVYAVMMAPPGTTAVEAIIDKDKIVARINASTRWYIYYETPEGVVVNSSNECSVLSLPLPSSIGYVTLTATTHELIEETVTITLPRTTTRTVTATATETFTTTATQRATETVTMSTTMTTTYTSTETIATRTPSTTVIGIAVVAGTAGAVLAYAVARRR